MSFDAHEEKIRKIFSGDARFMIPGNQRKYVWEEKQWVELMGDIEYINKRKKDSNIDISHFLGSFVLQEKDSSYEIIDGRQRITTLFLILSAICLRFNEIGDKKEHGKTRQYLSGNIGLQSQFMRLINESINNISFIMSQSCEYRENLCKGNLPDRALVSKEGDGNKQVIKCLYFYYGFLSENCSTSSELVTVRDIILDMKVIHIASEDELDCYDIFEILNARGVDLEAGWCLPSATGRKSAQRFESGGQVPGSTGYPARCFYVYENGRKTEWKCATDWGIIFMLAESKSYMRGAKKSEKISMSLLWVLHI